MRDRVAAASVALLLVLGLWAAPSSPAVGHVDAAGGPKVVIVVGATEATTSTYRSYADIEAAEALKYTPNVVKVYSPNATWAQVKAAAAGASIIIYHGHGNGWPSPYTYDPTYTTKDGFGLNKAANAGDYNRQYYGEPYMRDLNLAPNAVVLLGNLCYASGNSEPGNPEPTLSVAEQRADNYAAGFLGGNARAVIADGHMGLSYYIRALFTTHQSIEQLWRAAPNFHNHVISYASSRHAGLNARLDPEETSSRYYRSLVGNLALTTDQVMGSTDGLAVAPAPATTTREAGADRYATAAAVSAATYAPGVPVAYVANGLTFADALAGGPAAAKAGGPVLPVTATTIPSSIATELGRLKPARIVVLGSSAVVSNSVLAALDAYTTGG